MITGCKKLVFSSTASVYGNPIYFPIDEKHPISKKLNPYAQSKYIIEKYLLINIVNIIILVNMFGIILFIR